MDVELDLRWRLGGANPDELNPLLFGLLSGIREHGSLRRAALQAGVSYRCAWDTIKHWSERLGAPLVRMQRGRGAALTSLGERLHAADQRARERLRPELLRVSAEFREELISALDSGRPGTLRIFASHGLAVEVLRELAQRYGAPQIDLHNRGSIESLRLLNEARCDLAGFHVVDGALRERLADNYRAWLDPREDTLVKVATRLQGLMVARGNPKQIVGVADLARSGVRFVNRQRDSGTRLLLDALLRESGIRGDKIDGYQNEEFTHLAVAALIAGGAADSGLGVNAAASRFGLDFVPLASETYCFAVKTSRLWEPAIASLLSLLAGDEFRSRVRALPGYDPSGSGGVLKVEEVLPTP